jgi:hypothetical protein
MRGEDEFVAEPFERYGRTRGLRRRGPGDVQAQDGAEEDGLNAPNARRAGSG